MTELIGNIQNWNPQPSIKNGLQEIITLTRYCELFGDDVPNWWKPFAKPDITASVNAVMGISYDNLMEQLDQGPIYIARNIKPQIHVPDNVPSVQTKLVGISDPNEMVGTGTLTSRFEFRDTDIDMAEQRFVSLDDRVAVLSRLSWDMIVLYTSKNDGSYSKLFKGKEEFGGEYFMAVLSPPTLRSRMARRPDLLRNEYNVPVFKNMLRWVLNNPHLDEESKIILWRTFQIILFSRE